MNPRHVTASLVALAAVAGPIAGCGGSSPTPNAGQSGKSTQHAKPNASSRSKPNGGLGSLTIANFDPGSSATITLSKAGTYKYHCSIHPFMHGTLVVR